MLFFRSLKLLCIILILSCSPATNYHSIKKSNERVKSNSDSIKGSRSDNSTSEDSEVDIERDSTSGKPSRQDENQMEEELGKGKEKNEEKDMDDNKQPSTKLTEVNYKAPTPYNYPDNYNDPNSNSFPKRHMLVWHETPSSEVLINWGVDAFDPDDEHIVFLSETQQNGIDPEKSYELRFTAKESGVARTCDDEVDSNLQAEVTSLKPNTTYYYITRSNGQKSKEMHFVTAPSSNEVSFKLLSGGDSRSQVEDRRMMNGVMASMVTKDPQYIALVHGGDFINKGSSCDQWRSWRNDHQEIISENRRIIPLVATFGNHESTGTDGVGEKLFNGLFGDPLGKGDFYFLSTIGNLSLVVLNSQISARGDQQDWLQDTFEILKNKENHLIVAGYHAPAWPANKSPARTTAWVDEFQDYQVNLVLESDGHTLKQTCPVFVFGDLDDDEYRCDVDKGIIYVVSGRKLNSCLCNSVFFIAVEINFKNSSYFPVISEKYHIFGN
ncbi:MAG: fibronectin type III domain-containing protein [Oligoflexales bacterium]